MQLIELDELATVLDELSELDEGIELAMLDELGGLELSEEPELTLEAELEELEELALEMIITLGMTVRYSPPGAYAYSNPVLCRGALEISGSAGRYCGTSASTFTHEEDVGMPASQIATVPPAGSYVVVPVTGFSPVSAIYKRIALSMAAASEAIRVFFASLIRFVGLSATKIEAEMIEMIPTTMMSSMSVKP